MNVIGLVVGNHIRFRFLPEMLMLIHVIVNVELPHGTPGFKPKRLIATISCRTLPFSKILTINIRLIMPAKSHRQNVSHRWLKRLTTIDTTPIGVICLSDH